VVVESAATVSRAERIDFRVGKRHENGKAFGSDAIGYCNFHRTSVAFDVFLPESLAARPQWMPLFITYGS